MADDKQNISVSSMEIPCKNLEEIEQSINDILSAFPKDDRGYQIFQDIEFFIEK